MIHQPFTIVAVLLLLSARAMVQSQTLSLQQKFDLALDFAGKNKAELLKVTEHYSKNPKDSLKLKAARFLIANMTGHFAYTGYKQKGMDVLIPYVIQKEKQENRPLGTLFETPNRINPIWDSIMKVAKAGYKGPEYTFDNKVITADLLIENIDCSFKAWTYPWSRHLTFDQFCEYVLPHRFFNEPLQSWRLAYMKKYEWLIKAMKDSNSTDPVLACRLINDSLRRQFKFIFKMYQYPAAVSPGNHLMGGIGKCLDQAGFANFAMRAMGIPITLEQIPRWANRSLGHEFSTVLGKNGKFEAFLGTDRPPGKNEIRDVAPKIYRTMYSIQDDRLLDEDISIGELAPLFDRFQIDVTAQHIPVTDIKLTLKPNAVAAGERVQLCVFDDKSWAPFFSTVSADGKTVTFKDMGLGAVYLPAIIDNAVIPVANAFVLKKDKAMQQFLNAANNNENILLDRKYPMDGRKREWLKWMQDGLFEGANQPDFSDVRLLNKVDDDTKMKMNRKPVVYDSLRAYEYIPKDLPDTVALTKFKHSVSVFNKEILAAPLKGKLMPQYVIADPGVEAFSDPGVKDFTGIKSFEPANEAQWRSKLQGHLTDSAEYILVKEPDTTTRSFRYLRYRFPDKGYGSLAELAFYGDTSLKIPLTGKLISSPKVGKEHLELAFDGKLGNYIHTDGANDYSNEWIGLDLGKPQYIAGVGYSPRNDENGIKEGMNYELYYWNDKWVSLGKGVFDAELRLVFNKVPKGALLLLRNHTEGKEERIFRYVNGQQEWW